mgnify:CR=1 FL=1
MIFLNKGFWDKACPLVGARLRLVLWEIEVLPHTPFKNYSRDMGA